MFGRDEKVSSFRLTGVQYFILGIFLVLAYGLWRLQVVSSEFYSALAEKNKTREVPILAPRGKILDRDGREIVTNYPSFTALLLRDSTRDLSVDAEMIAQGLHLDPNEVRERLHKFAGTPQYQPIYLKEDITRTSWLLSGRTAMNCPNSTRSWRIAACIRATGSWPT